MTNSVFGLEHRAVKNKTEFQDMTVTCKLIMNIHIPVLH